MESEIYCSICNKTFRKKKKLKAHCRKLLDTDFIPIKPIQCKHCNDQFSSQKTLGAHLMYKNIDTTKRIRQRTRIICPLDSCNEDLFTFVKLRKHLTQEHSIEIEYEEVNFRHFSDFEKWKHTIEQQTLSMYVLNRAPTLLCQGKIRKYYYCRHACSYRRQSNNKNNIMSTRSNNIDKACPAMIRVTISGSDRALCTAQYWKTHCGHSQKIQQVHLDHFDNNAILHANINSEEQENIMHINKPSLLYETTANNYNNFNILSQTNINNTLGTTRTSSDHKKYLINKHLAKVLKIMNEENKVQPVNNVNTPNKIKPKQRKKKSQSKTLNKLINTILSGIKI